MTDMTKNRVLYGLLEPEEKAVIDAAWPNVEFFCGGESWPKVVRSEPHPFSVYRLPKREITIPWDMIDEKWEYVAMNEDGSVWAWTHTPLTAGRQWARGVATSRTQVISTIFSPDALYLGEDWTVLHKRPE